MQLTRPAHARIAQAESPHIEMRKAEVGGPKPSWTERECLFITLHDHQVDYDGVVTKCGEFSM